MITIKTKLVQLTFFLLALLLFSSCARVFFSPDASTLAKQHKKIAIIPPTVLIVPRKNADKNAIIEQQKLESLNFQKEIYSWLLKRKQQGRINPDILDAETTNAILSKYNYPETPLKPNELCQLLQVDGVITSRFSLNKPMSEGGAVALGLLFGFWGSTNEVHATLSIHDNSKEKLIWNYEHKFSGSIGSTPGALVDRLMRKASKKLPYNKN